MGSSARMMWGLLTSDRAMATRCCWPPESCEGRWSRRSARPTSSAMSMHRCLAAADRSPLVAQRHCDVLDDGQLGDEVVRLEDEAEASGCGCRTARRRRAAKRRCPPRTYWPRGGAVEAAQQVQQRALARARGAHDGHEVPLAESRATRRAGRGRRCRAEDVVLVEVDDLGGHVHGTQSLCGEHSIGWRACSSLAGRGAGTAAIHGGGPRSGPCWLPAGPGTSRTRTPTAIEIKGHEDRPERDPRLEVPGCSAAATAITSGNTCRIAASRADDRPACRGTRRARPAGRPCRRAPPSR